MFGLIPKSMWSKWIEADADNRIWLSMNCVLLERTTQSGAVERILVESGAGGKWTPKEEAIYLFERCADGRVRTVEHALQEIDIDPASITHVILTHLHFDHAGGLTRLSASGALELVFPNARVHVQRQEWLDALANKSTMSRTYLPTNLEPLQGCVVLHDGDAEPVTGIRVRVGSPHGAMERQQGNSVFPGRHHAHHSSCAPRCEFGIRHAPVPDHADQAGDAG
jgi:glyoxylase-like metal-dependent hydrolase (beta-lactamase superfamily II)